MGTMGLLIKEACVRLLETRSAQRRRARLMGPPQKNDSPAREESNERTLEGSHHRWGIWWAFCGPALELKSGGRDAYRSAKLSPFPTTTLSSRDGLAFGGGGRLAPSERPKPAEKYSRLVGDCLGHRS